MDIFGKRALRLIGAALILGLSLATSAAYADPPVVSTVPVDPQDPIQPHDIISGKPTTLKGAVDEDSVGATWTWNPGDGSASVSGSVAPAATAISQMDDAGFTPHYAIWIEHNYTGTDGDVFLATLTVTNTDGESDSAVYRMRMRNATITTEVNVAIDEALWFMHRNFFRFDGAPTQSNGSTSGGGVPMGKWDFVQTGGLAQGSSTAAAVNAFEANGYLPNGPDSSPYTETVSRGLTYVLASLGSQGITPQTRARAAGEADDPDVNGNGIGVYLIGTDPPYQGGMVMDAIIATGTPDAVATVGRTDILGRTYGDIIQDMVDYYAFAQSDNTAHGGWRYGAWNNSSGTHDNSTGGWAAIGLVAAEDIFGATVPEWVKERNRVGLEFTDFESDTDDYVCCGNDRGDGTHGYTATGPIWGPFSTTSAAMVQMTMDDIESTTAATPDERWIRSENFFRRHFNSPVTGNTFKNYYYAMFNFAKAMRTAVPEEVVLIGTDNSVGCGPGGGTPGCSDEVAPLDWYLDPADGLARTVVDYQVTTGVNIGMFSDRSGNSHGNRQDEYNTSWATQILTRTLFQAGPVARATATPNPGASNSPILLDATESFHQDPARSLVNYDWDFDNDGTFDATGVTVTTSFDCPTLPVPCEYPVRLRVTDNNVPARFDDDVVVVEITIPPRPPTADAGGPYLACAAEEFSLDGSGSFDVDQGTSESGSEPFDMITAYNWELDGISPFDFDEASGVAPLVSFPVPDTRDIGLQVADNTALAFPTAQQPNLTDRDFTSVEVGDCSCIGPVAARTKPGKAQLVWNPVAGATSYDILRSVQGSAARFDTVAVDHVTDYASYLDRGLTNGTTYWYRVIPKGADGMPICAFSRAVAATPQESRRARTAFVQVPDLVGLDQSAAEAALLNEGLAVGDISFANDPVIPEGAVSASVPSAGNRVAEGTPVDLVVSLGPERVPVPDIVGETQGDAEALIVGAGLVVGSITTQNSATIPEGDVISQDPPGGVEVVLGSDVNFVVSLGPVTATVPDVVGSSQADGEAAIAAAGLPVGAITTDNSATVPSGDIISQNPPGDTEVVLGTAVDLVVSLGPVTVIVPDVIGLPQADAETAVLAADLTVGSIVTQNSAVVPAGNVINQSPGAGSNVVPGVSVNLVISLGSLQVIVPDVIGFAQADAEAALVGADLGAGTITEENSLTVPAGNVINQDPAPGTEVDESSLVALVVSIGPREVTVPDVVGQTQANAEAAIIAADLVVGTVTTDTSATVPAGNVISQSPVGGTTVDEQSAVALVVSSGPVQVTVPNVVGQEQANAETAIVAAGLTVGAITTSNHPTIPAGSVISQSPEGGTSVDEGTAVDLGVSLGPAQVTVPDVVGDTQANAASQISATGLAVGTISNANSDTVPTGSVISQDPIGGATVNEGTAVDLVISIGPADIAVPNVVGQAEGNAGATLVAAGLSVGSTTTAPSFAVPAGSVISQNPTAGTLVGPGTAVNLVVSEGAPDDDEPPLLSASLDRDPGSYDQGENVLLSINATDNSGSVDLTVALDGGAASPAVQGVNPIATGALAVGSGHSLLVTATDGAGNTATETLFFGITDPADASGPVVAISAPAADSALTGQTDVTGTASDANLVNYVLEYAPNGTSDFAEFATGTTSVTAGLLGVFDPTILTNGLYEIRLTATDVNGVSASTSIVVEVEGDLKLGQFSVSFTDKELDIGAFPLQIMRNYDSRNRAVEGAFGYGWSLGLSEAELKLNTPLGLNWSCSVAGGFFNTYTLIASRPHTVSVRLNKDDEEERKFAAVPSPQSQQLFPLDFINAMNFTPIGSTEGTLQATESPSFLNPSCANSGVSIEITDFNFNTYNPDGYVYTAPDGFRYRFSRSGGGQLGLRQILTSITDPNGTTVNIGPGGITRSDGLGFAFTRDAQGRITELTDPNGNVVLYSYDSRGDLVGVTDPEGNTTTFIYDSNHFLLKIIDPLGRPVQRQEYDDDGRLIAITDAAGERVELEYDIDNNTQIVRDRRGNPTIYEYDGNGNVTLQTDFPLVDGVSTPVTIQRSYNVDGDMISETNELGHTTTFSYDANGNLLSKTDPLGNTESFTYNARNQVLTNTDKRGNTITNAYDAQGRITSKTDRNGGVTTYSYDGSGNLTSRTDALGNATTFTYDAQGRRLTETDPLGNTTTFTYDSNGNRLAETDPLGNTTTFEYDARDLKIAEIDPLGNRTEFVYDAAGTQIAVIDPLGNRVERTFDDRGNVIRADYPNGTFVLTNYDSDGNRTAVTNRSGATTNFAYDALDRLTVVTHPDGTTKEQRYDAAGNVIGEIDEAGNRTDHEYDAAGRRIRTLQPQVFDTFSASNLRPETLYEYDANANRTAVTDALGGRTEFAYNALDKVTTTTLPDGNTTVVAYDLLGREISKTDAAGDTTSYAYDAAGRLISVTDPLGGVTTYGYDAAGNRTSQTDANGNTTLFEYDAAGRRTARQLPGGQRETFTYDAAGRKISHTDFNGETHSFTYDEVGQQITAAFADGTFANKSYTGEGAPTTVTDNRGLTTNAYDNRGRLLTTTDPAGRVTTYTYTSRGEVQSVASPTGDVTSYTYDALNRLASVTDPDGGVTTYGYDAVGNQTLVEYPNGTRAEYTYNVRHQLVLLENLRSDGSVISSFAYVLDARGLRTQVTEADGGVVDYTYDASGRLLTEVRSGSEAFSATYVYDAVGNRTQVTRDGVVTNYTYDSNDRLQTAGPTSYTYDGNGNLVQQSDGLDTTTYSFDSQNRLVQSTSPAGVTTGYEYDYAGNRVATLDGTGTIIIEYLLDKRSRTGVAQVLAEVDAAGTRLVHYTYGADLISQERGTARSFYHYDGLGSTRELSDGVAVVTDSYVYDAYGREVARSGSTTNLYRFTGEQFDPSVGLYYLRARYYAPDQGRFISMDPFMGDPQAPMSLHRYLYAADNPVNFVDPTGKFSLVSISVSISINTNIRSIYTKNLITFFAKALKIAFCVIEPGYRMRDAGLLMVANNIPGGIQLVMQGQQIVVEGLQAIGAEIRQTYQNIATDIVNVKFEVTGLLVDLINAIQSGEVPVPVPEEVDKLIQLKDQVENALSEFSQALEDIDALINGNDCDRFTVIADRISLITDRIPDF